MMKEMKCLIYLLFFAVVVNVSQADLVASYHLEDAFEKSGDTVINSVSGVSGAWGDGVVEDRNVAGTNLIYVYSVSGSINKGLHFEDLISVLSSNHIAIDTGSQFTDGDNFTIMGWSKTVVATTTWRSMMFGQYSSTGATAGNMYLSPCDKSNGFKARLFLGSNCPVLMSTDAYNDGQWHHVAATYDGSVVKLYVDAVEVASESFSGIVFNPDSNLAIGNLSNVNVQKMPTTGTYDELRVYTNALSDSEIATIYNQSSYVNIVETDDETKIAEAIIVDTLDVSLSQVPTGDVVFTADPNAVDVGNGVGVPVELTFTPANWDVPQTITVTSTDDSIDKGVRTDIIVNTVASSDVIYDGNICIIKIYTIINNITTVASSDVIYDGIYLNNTNVTIFDDDGSCGDWGVLAGDINGDCYVTLVDLEMMVAAWLDCTEPGVLCDYEL